jgi:molecular chaperone DnaJ
MLAMPKRDYYDVLGVSKDADDKTIKSAFRKLAMANHPDRNPNDEAAAERFKEANEAYEILKDKDRRAAYDQMGHAAFEQGGGFGGGGFPGGFSDIFEQMFSEFSGGRGQTSHARHGADLRYDLEIDLEDAFTGCSKDISANISVSCDHCGGSGAASGSKPVTCNSCGGIGKVRAQQGFFTVERVCPSCQGAGETISDPCRPCRGQGRVEKSETLAVNIPAGVDTGTRIRLSGKGEAGLRGAPAGDLYIFIAVKKHPLFERDGMNLYLRVPLPMVTAALGGKIDVPTLAGKMTRLQIDEGTQTGRKFRMRGKGMPALRGSGQGDQIVEIEVETPTQLTKKQKAMLKEFDEAGDSSPQTQSFIERVKGLWS